MALYGLRSPVLGHTVKIARRREPRDLALRRPPEAQKPLVGTVGVLDRFWRS